MSSEVTSSINGSNNKSALGYMLAAMMLFSMLSIAFVFGGASKAPFLFVGLTLLFSGISSTIYLLIRYTKKINRETFKIIYANLRHPALVWVALGHFDYAIFAFALRYIDAAVATILIEMRPIIMVMFMVHMFKQQTRYKEVTLQKWFLFAIAFIGVAFVIASQSTTIGNAVGELFTYGTIIGVGLALLVAFLSALPTPASIKWGTTVSKSIGTDDEEFYSVTALIVVRVLTVPSFFIIGVLSGESIQSIGSIGVSIAIVFGAFGLGLAMIFLRIANIKTTNLGINALGYATPVVALIWLALASLINVPHVDWLIIGVAAIIAANLLLNFKVEIRAAYKALIIALWVCGTSVYLHTSFPLPDYVEIVGVIATLFILILAFRVDRLVRRTTEEENNEFFLFHQLSVLVKSGGINNDAPNQLREIGRHIKPSELRNSYGTLKKYFMDAHNKLAKDDRAMLGELEARVDALTHSKQQGANFGELTALGFMGFIMVSALLLFKPVELSGWEGLFVETSSFLLATAIVFLFANIFDLQHDRTNAILAKEDGNDFYSVAFDDAGDRGSERWISITVCIAITAAYIWLFLGKWIF